jgi:hypothetical protein
MTKIQDQLAALKERVDAAPAEERPTMLVTGLNAAMAQAISDAKMAGLSDAQLMGFDDIQKAMDSGLGGGDVVAQAPA